MEPTAKIAVATGCEENKSEQAKGQSPCLGLFFTERERQTRGRRTFPMCLSRDSIEVLKAKRVPLDMTIRSKLLDNRFGITSNVLGDGWAMSGSGRW